MKLTYRPEIDGLRAIAVVAVIIYHLKISFYENSFLGGGFLGVDIFFVISGYLISMIIFKELKKTGTISFVNFYQRRVRRIIPALVFLILISLPVAWYLILPVSFVDFSKSIISSLSFVSNFYFYFSGQEYGSEEGLFKPFLHTWSLSIEEQFYILFPVFIFLVFKVFRKHLKFILLLSFLISLVIANWGLFRLPAFNFYILPSRGWELLAGSLLAYFEINNKVKTSTNLNANFFSFVGLILILISIFIFSEEIKHPSFYTLPTVIGVSLIIWFSKDKNNIINKVLSSKLLVSTGIISYSLYLWHFPIFAFGRMNIVSESLLDKLIWIILTIIFSIFSYLFIEKFFRDKKRINFKNTLIFLLTAYVIIIVLSLKIVKNDGYETRFKDLKIFYGINNPDNTFLRKKSWSNLNNKIVFKKSDEKKNILFVGDSLSKDMFNIFDQNKKLFSEYNFARFGGALHSQSLKIINFHPKAKNSDTEMTINRISKDINFKNSDIVVISNRFNKKEVESLDNLVSFLQSNKKKVVLTSNANEYKTYKGPYRTLVDIEILKAYKNKSKPDFSDIKFKMFNSRLIKDYENINLLLENFANEKNIIFLKKNEFLCNETKKECEALTPKGFKIHYDYNHITLEGAKYLGYKIYKKNWFKIN